MNALEARLLRQYLDGEFDQSELDAFELMLLQRPDLAEAVDVDNALRLGLRQVVMDKRPLSTPVAVGRVSEVREPANDYPRPATSRWPVALAASLSMLAVGLVMGSRWHAGGPPIEGVSVAYVDKTRSISTTPRIELHPQRPLVLMVPVASAERCAADIEIRATGGEIKAMKVQPDEFGYASVVVGSDALRPGPATVQVRCAGRDAGAYPVEFVVAAANE